jgi:hypothetical protein
MKIRTEPRGGARHRYLLPSVPLSGTSRLSVGQLEVPVTDASLRWVLGSTVPTGTSVKWYNVRVLMTTGFIRNCQPLRNVKRDMSHDVIQIPYHSQV